MMRHISAAILLCLLACALAVAQTKTDLELQGLAGPVQTVISKTIEAPLRDGKPGTAKETSRSITFDQQGRKILESLNNPDGTPSRRWRFIYDANGYKSAQVEYYPPERLIGTNYYRYEFDGKGRVVTMLIIDGDGKLAAKMVKTYNDRGLLAENTTFDRNGAVSNKSVFKYDEFGGIAEFALYDSAGVLLQKQIHTSSQNDMLLTGADGTPRRKEVRSAPSRDEFDARGNWTKATTKKVVTESGRTEQQIEVIRRFIIYY